MYVFIYNIYVCMYSSKTQCMFSETFGAVRIPYLFRDFTIHVAKTKAIITHDAAQMTCESSP